MGYSGNMAAWRETKDYLISQNRNFTCERSGNFGKIKLRNSEYYYFNKGLDPTIPNLCKIVKADAKKWLKENPSIKETSSKKIVHFNKIGLINSVGSLVYGWDINSCYWNIALREGIISQATYEKGNVLKLARLQAIGNLNKANYIITQKNGEITKEKIVPETSVIWSLINDEIYQMYEDVHAMFGDDLLCWYTDCLYCRRDVSEELTAYFKTKGLEIKQENIEILSLGSNQVNYWSYKKEKEMAFRFIFPRKIPGNK